MAENTGKEIQSGDDWDDDDGSWKELIQDVDGFYNEETQSVVTGKVISVTQMELARRLTQVAIIRLSKPCVAVKGSGDDKEEVPLEAGQAIGVVIKHKLQDLYSMVDNQCEVKIKAVEKISLDNGNTMWRYGLKFKGQRTGLAASGARNADSGSKSADRKGKPEPSAKGKTGQVEEF